MRRLLRRTLLVLPLAAAAACGSSSTEPTTPPVVPIEQTTFATSLGIDLSTYTKAPEGYYYKDLVAGNGATVATGDSILVGATGYLKDGTTFYSTAGQAPIAIRLGTTKVLSGWTLGLVGAPIGGVRRLILPPSLAYGGTKIVDAGSGKVVAANSNVVFDLTVYQKVQ